MGGEEFLDDYDEAQEKCGSVKDGIIDTGCNVCPIHEYSVWYVEETGMKLYPVAFLLLTVFLYQGLSIAGC